MFTQIWTEEKSNKFRFYKYRDCMDFWHLQSPDRHACP